MYIEDSYYHQFPKRSVPGPRERFKQYYRDLHKRYDMDLNETTFISGSKYKFNELGYQVLDQCHKKGYLHEIDVMVLANWAHEYDPDYAACGLHFSHHYGFNCEMYDVIDQGSICTVTALWLIKSVIDSAKYNKAICFSIDQTTNPRSAVDTIPIPTVDACSSLILTRTNQNKSHLEVVDIKIWTEQQLCHAKFDIPFLISCQLKCNDIGPEQCVLFVKMGSTASRAINLYRHKDYFMKQIEVSYVRLENGCTEILRLIHKLCSLKQVSNQPYILIFDEDIESLTSGMIILHNNNNK